jgi:hypothetical protein
MKEALPFRRAAPLCQTAESSYRTCSTLFTSWYASINARSIPALRVIIDMGHDTQDPVNLTSTIPSSVSRTNSTSPPSRRRNGRMLVRLSATISLVNISQFEPPNSISTFCAGGADTWRMLTCAARFRAIWRIVIAWSEV